MLLKSIKIATPVEINPSLLSDPEKAINRKITSYLLKYSQKMEGIPLAFKVGGVTPTGMISPDSGGVLITTLIEYIVLKISPGSSITSIGGMVLGVFYVEVDGNEEYSGDFVVSEVKCRGNSPPTIIGTQGQ